jgi:hypothetical protein
MILEAEGQYRARTILVHAVISDWARRLVSIDERTVHMNTHNPPKLKVCIITMIDIGILPSVRNPRRDAAALPETVAIRELDCLVNKQANGVADAGTKSRSPRNVRFAMDQHGIIQTHIQTAELPLDYANDDMHWSSKEKALEQQGKGGLSPSNQERRAKIFLLSSNQETGSCLFQWQLCNVGHTSAGYGAHARMGSRQGARTRVSRFGTLSRRSDLRRAGFRLVLPAIDDESGYNEQYRGNFCPVLSEKTSSTREFAIRMAACDAMAAHSDSCQSRSVNTSKACRRSGVVESTQPHNRRLFGPTGTERIHVTWDSFPRRRQSFWNPRSWGRPKA